MGGHARFSPSSGKRRLECPPSLLLEEQFPDEESPFAAEGSAGHVMAEYLINKYLKKRTKRPVSDYYSDELLEAVDDYVEYNITQIEQARKDCDEPFIGVELKVSLAHRIEGCFGTADMVVVDSHKIHIIDLKLGKGVVVDAEQNVQLMIYGLGVLDMLGFLYEIDTVELTIVQPRIEHFSTWEISAGELLAWGKDVLEPGAAKALSGEGEFKAGDHCRFCKARFTCRARAEEYLKLAQMEFAEPALMSDEEIAEVLSKADALKKWAEEVYTYAQNEAVYYQSGMLKIALPSGRVLSYVRPRMTVNRFGSESVSYEGIGTNRKWTRIESYGAKFCENIVQATARDVLAEAMLRLEKKGFDIVCHIHDEVVLEVPEGTSSVEEVNGIMAVCPDWCEGLPLKAAGFESPFYKKD